MYSKGKAYTEGFDGCVFSILFCIKNTSTIVAFVLLSSFTREACEYFDLIIQIYSSDVQSNKANSPGTKAPFLDLHVNFRWVYFKQTLS